jgi:host factor-I protein
VKNETTENFEEYFLDVLRRKKIPATVYLINGVKLQGVVGNHDDACITLRRGPQMQLIYKHAVATVVPSGPLSPEEMGSDDVGDDAAGY